MEDGPGVELRGSKLPSNVPLYPPGQLEERRLVAIICRMHRPLPRPRLIPVSIMHMVDDTIANTIEIKLYKASALDYVTERVARHFEFDAPKDRVGHD